MTGIKVRRTRIEVLARPEMISRRRPRVADWWVRIQARPSYKTAFSFAILIPAIR